MLLMVEKGIRGGSCGVIHHYAKANNKYMNNYDKTIESSYIVFFRCKQFVRVGDVSKTFDKGF